MFFDVFFNSGFGTVLSVFVVPVWDSVWYLGCGSVRGCMGFSSILDYILVRFGSVQCGSRLWFGSVQCRFRFGCVRGSVRGDSVQFVIPFYGLGIVRLEDDSQL